MIYLQFSRPRAYLRRERSSPPHLTPHTRAPERFQPFDLAATNLQRTDVTSTDTKTKTYGVSPVSADRGIHVGMFLGRRRDTSLQPFERGLGILYIQTKSQHLLSRQEI